MPATESLTIEILGDSSGLSQALDDALSRVESLQSATDSAAGSASGVGPRLASVSVALQPLQQVSQQLTRISQQAQALSQQPISLNVQPALSALQTLMSAIQAVAAQLRSISVPSGVGGGRSGGASTGSSPRNSNSPAAASAPRLAAPPSLGVASMMELSAPRTSAPAGAVQSLVAPRDPRRQQSSAEPVAPSRSSVISDTTHLPIREFVSRSLHQSSQDTGLDSRRAAYSLPALPLSGSSREQTTPHDHSSSTVNHFGGITIAVRETADVNSLMRDLRLQGLSTRHRQG